MRRTERINRNTGEIYPPTPEGIDVRFDHNHGRSNYFANAGNIVDDRLGTKVTQLNVDSDNLERLVTGQTRGVAAVGYLPDGLPELIQAQSSRVLLSDDTITKQLVKHPEIKVDDYRFLPELFRSGLVIQQSSQTLLFYHVGNTIYRAAVKSTRDGRELFLVSLHKADQSAVNRARNNGNVVREEL